MSETETRHAGRPRALTPPRLSRLFALLQSGMSISAAARLVGTHRSTILRELQTDPDLRAQAERARATGRNVKETITMATTTTTPEEELAELQRQRQHLSLDVVDGVAGASQRLHAVEARITEVERDIDRAILVEHERQRREEERAAREHQRQRADALASIKKQTSALHNAYAEVESASETLVAAIRRATAIGGERYAAQITLRRLDGDETLPGADTTKDRITDRITHRLNRECGLADVRSNSAFGFGEQPLTQIEK